MRSLLVLALVASCYQPTVQTGLPCSENGTCPAGQTCERGVCLTMPLGDDASDTDAALIDAAPSDSVDARIDAPVMIDAAPLAWTETTALPSQRSFHCAAAFGNRIYVTGGTYLGGYKVDVVMAQVQTNGTLGAWTAMTDLPTGNRWHGCAVDPVNPSLYVIGGDNGTTSRTEVLRAPINPTTGAVGAWVAQTAMPAGRRGASVEWNAGTLYVLGGEEVDGFNVRDTVYRATTTSTGIAAWTTQTNLFPADYMFGTATANGRIYKTGGYTGHEVVRVSTIGGTGALGTFATTMAMPSQRERHVSVTDGTYVYALGGESSFGSANLDSVIRSPINANGSLGAWSALPSLPVAVAYAAGVLVNGRIYIMGGSDGTSPIARVFILSGL